MQNIAADLVNMLECDKEELTVISFVAKSVLLNNPDILLSMPTPTQNPWKAEFKDYIPQNWIEKQRKTIKTLHILDRSIPFVNENLSCRIESKIQFKINNGIIVLKGKEVCSYVKLKKEFKYSKSNPSLLGFSAAMHNNLLNEEKFQEKYFINAIKDGVFYAIKSVYKKIKDLEEEYLTFYITSYFDTFENLEEWHNKQLSNLSNY